MSTTIVHRFPQLAELFEKLDAAQRVGKTICVFDTPMTLTEAKMALERFNRRVRRAPNMVSEKDFLIEVTDTSRVDPDDHGD